MKNKLLATTAMVGLGLTGSAMAELKIGGNIEYVGQYITGPTAADSKQLDGIESNLALSYAKKADFGTINYGFKLENGLPEGENITLDTGSVVFQVGSDAFQNLSATAVPNTGESYKTVTSNLTTAYATNYAADGTNYNAFGYAIGAKAPGGMLSLRYTQDSSSGNGTTHSTGAVNSGTPTMTIMYKGSLGVDGLNVIAGTGKIDAGDSNTAEGKHNNVSASYKFGKLQVGAGYKTFENQTTPAAQDEFKSLELGIGYALTDKFSVALQHIRTDGDTNGVNFVNKEKITGFGVGYNLGGLALEISYADVQDISGVSGSDGEVVQIRTIQSF